MSATKTIQFLLLAFLLRLSFQQSSNFLPKTLDEVGDQVREVLDILGSTIYDEVINDVKDATGQYDDLISEAVEYILTIIQDFAYPSAEVDDSGLSIFTIDSADNGSAGASKVGDAVENTASNTLDDDESVASFFANGVDPIPSPSENFLDSFF